MRAGRLDRKVVFYALSTSRGDFGEAVETWPTATITTWAEITYAGGDAILSNDEKFYTGTLFLRVRYRSEIVETMRVLIDSEWYRIIYIQRLGRKEGLQITVQKVNE
jgi:head-tail adaptor